MVQFIGSWFIAYLLGGGLILAVLLYFVFFKKNSLMNQAVEAIKQAAARGTSGVGALQTN